MRKSPEPSDFYLFRSFLFLLILNETSSKQSVSAAAVLLQSPPPKRVFFVTLWGSRGPRRNRLPIVYLKTNIISTRAINRGFSHLLPNKIRLHGRREKRTAESFSREKSRQAPQKEGREVLCETFLLRNPGWCVHKSDVQNKWDNNTHTHTHIPISLF